MGDTVQLQGDRLSDVFSALADPTRRAMVERLSRGDATLTELSEPFSMSLQAVSRHLKVLEQAGLVRRGRHAQQRPAHLLPEPLGAIADWLYEYREFWEESYDRLAELLATRAEPRSDRKDEK